MVFSSSSEESSSSSVRLGRKKISTPSSSTNSKKKQNLPPAPQAPPPATKTTNSQSSPPAPNTATTPDAQDSPKSAKSPTNAATTTDSPKSNKSANATSAASKSEDSPKSNKSQPVTKKTAPATDSPKSPKAEGSPPDTNNKSPANSQSSKSPAAAENANNVPATTDSPKSAKSQPPANDAAPATDSPPKAEDNATPEPNTNNETPPVVDSPKSATKSPTKAKESPKSATASPTAKAEESSPKSATNTKTQPPPPPFPKPPPPRTSVKSTGSSTGGSLDSSIHSSQLSSSKRSQLSPNSVMQADLQKPADTTTAAQAQVPVAPETPQHLRGNAADEEEKQEIASITGEPPGAAAQTSATQTQASSGNIPTPPQPMQLSESPIQQQSSSSPSSSATKTPPPPPPSNDSYEDIIEEQVSGDVEDFVAQGHPIITTDNLHAAISEDSELTVGTAFYGDNRRSTSTGGHNVIERVESHGIVYEVIEEEIVENSEDHHHDNSPTSNNNNNEDEDIIQQEVRFANPLVVDLLEYRQEFDSPLSVNVAHHVPPDHDPYFVPWYEQDYQELPWYEQPDLEVDGAVTRLCKKVLLASEDHEDNLQRLAERAVRVESHIINFANKLKNKRAQRIQQLQWQEEQHKSWEIPPPPPPPIPAQVPMTKLTPTISISSLVSGPESVYSSSSGSGNNRDQRKRQSRQQAFQSQQNSARMQNIPSRAEGPLGKPSAHSMTTEQLAQEASLFMGSPHVSIGKRQRWSFVDSGAIPKRWKQSPQSQYPHPSSAKVTPKSSLRHSISDLRFGNSDSRLVTPPPTRWSDVDNIGQRLAKNRATPPQQQKQSQQQRHSIAVAPSRQRQSPATNATQTLPRYQTFIPEHAILDTYPEENNSNSSSSSEVDPRPIYARVATPQTTSMSRSTPPSRGKNNSRSSSLVNLNGEDSTNSVYSVPFDEEQPYAREFFQDELYYETVKKRGKKRVKPRKVSSSTRTRDPPAVAASTTKQRKEPDPLYQSSPNPWETPMRESMISDVVIPVKRQMSNLSEISDVDYGIDNKGSPRHPQTIGQSMWDPPPHLKEKIREAEKQQEKLNKNPTPIPDFAIADIEELKEQWKAYAARTSPTNSQETIYMDDHLLSEASRHTQRRARRKNRSGMGVSNHSHASFASSAGGFSLAEEERQRLQYKRVESGDAATDGDMTPMHYAMAHLHDDEKEELTFLESIWANIFGIGICLLLLATWIFVMVACFTDIGAPPFSSVGNITTLVPTVEPTTPETAPTSAPSDDTPQLDGEELLPAWSWDVIQRDGNSPQWKAWEWLQESDTESYSDERLLQRFAIATFYFATSADYNTGGETVALGANSTEVETDSVEQDDGWLDPDTSECTWNSGITCNDDEQVDSFTFSNQNLVGTLPNELGLLTNLLSLDLGENLNLQGTLPTQLSLLTVLLGLDLHSCDLTGSIPSELGLLTNMLWMTLATQGGSSDLSTVRNTGNRKLSSTIPTELALLTSLEHLRLDDNMLTGPIPPLLSNIGGLRTLLLRRNLLTGSVPAELSRLLQLGGLALDSCELTGRIPDEFSRMTSLAELHLYNNQMQGPLPASLGRLSDTLTRLTLSGNEFFGPLPVAWQSLSNLEVLQLDQNSELTGTIPVEWGAQWPDLRQIMLQGTSLDGEVPVGLCFLKDTSNGYSLETIGISCDKLTCTCGCTCL